jgi:uncharacterized protein YoxC
MASVGMKKQLALAIVILGVTLSLVSMDIPSEIAEIKENIGLLTALAEGRTRDLMQQNEKDAALIQRLGLLTQNLQAQDQEIRVLRNNLQGLAARVEQLEQQPGAKPQSTAQKIFSHPLTWFGLIAVCALASIVHERWHKKEKDIEQETNTIVLSRQGEKFRF